MSMCGSGIRFFTGRGCLTNTDKCFNILVMYLDNFAQQHIPSEDIEFIGSAWGVLRTIYEIAKSTTDPDLDIGKIGLNCHTVTRLLARNVPELRVVDGWFYCTHPSKDHPGAWSVRSCSHSWLLTPTGGTIIDPFPLNVMAVENIIAVPTRFPEEYRYTCYNLAGNYEEAVLDERRYDPVQTLLEVIKIESMLRLIVKNSQ